MEIQVSVTRGVLERTLSRFAELLESLPAPYAFTAVALIDAEPRTVRDNVERLAGRARSSDSSFCFYYFGHGALTADQELSFVHPGAKKGEYKALKLSTVESDINESEVGSSLTILDCC